MNFYIYQLFSERGRSPQAAGHGRESRQGRETERPTETAGAMQGLRESAGNIWLMHTSSVLHQLH